MLFTTINGVMVPNTCCVDCFKETGRMIEGKNTDHIVPRKAGGSDEHHNLQTQCDRHHAVKSSNEGKKQPGK
jgi:5-methylcytosine-specific restriction endonuclease McrA